MSRASQPIGIFDSGIGGLTVAQAIRERLPHEDIIYFGDTAHMPYGEKSAQAVSHYSKKISEYLIAQGCKTLVIACNTASALAFDSVRKHVDEQIPVENVIDPVVHEVTKGNAFRKVGVIGTRATIQSRIYEIKLKEAQPSLIVESVATPLLAQMIEEGFVKGVVCHEVLQKYLSEGQFESIEGLILGCTHYPMIQNEVKAVLSSQVKIFDSPKIVAEQVAQTLERQQLLNTSNRDAKVRCEISQMTENFVRLSKVFFSGELKIESPESLKLR